MTPEVIFWIVALVIFVVVEAATVSLVSIWFAGGAIIAMISAYFGAAIWLQVLLFFIVSGIIVFLIRPLAKKYITAKKTSTNADMALGAEGIVLEDIDNLRATGRVKVGSLEWTARSVSDEPIKKGSLIKGVRIEGVKLIVEPAQEKQPAYTDA